MELPINIVISKYAVQIYLMVILEHNSKIELELAYVLCGVCVCIIASKIYKYIWRQ